MAEYIHKVQYYETDKMGITHHSNYIRWMEEARIDFLGQIGWAFDKLEESGIVSPVVHVDCNYKKTTTFSEQILIKVEVAEYRGVKLVLNYVMKNAEGQVVCEGSSSHCFMDTQGKMLRLQKQVPEFHEKLLSLLNIEE